MNHTKTVKGERRIHARIPDRFNTMRIVRVDENTDEAIWTGYRNGKIIHVPGRVTNSDHGFNFHPTNQSDLNWIMNEYVPKRNSYGPIANDLQAAERGEFLRKRRKEYQKNYRNKKKQKNQHNVVGFVSTTIIVDDPARVN